MNDTIVGIILKVEFGDRSAVYEDKYLAQLRTGEWLYWNTPRKYKALEGGDKKIIFYDRTRRAVTGEVVIQDITESGEEADYPWRNDFAPGSIDIYPKALPIAKLRRIPGYKNLCVPRKDRTPYRLVTAVQYRLLNACSSANSETICSLARRPALGVGASVNHRAKRTKPRRGLVISARWFTAARMGYKLI